MSSVDFYGIGGPNSELEPQAKDPITGNRFLRYPLDVGSDPIYKHAMRIAIYRQEKSKFFSASLSPNAFNADRESGRAGQVPGNKELIPTQDLIELAGGAAVLAGAAAAKGIPNILPGNSLAQLATKSKIGKMVGDAVSKVGTAGLGIFEVAGENVQRQTVNYPVSYIYLYMPNQMTFGDKHDYDPVSVTEALGVAGIASNLGAATTTGELGGLAGEASGIFGKNFKQVAMFAEGYALNPQLEIMYQKTNNRQFAFDFVFTPRNSDEADEVISIIKTLRYHASPEYAADLNTSRYFIPPSEFDIEFYHKAERNRYLPKIAQCVLSDVQVNYAPSGRFATFDDSKPVEIALKLTFTETVILTKKDIELGF